MMDPILRYAHVDRRGEMETNGEEATSNQYATLETEGEIQKGRNQRGEYICSEAKKETKKERQGKKKENQ
jgi:hypothetical protein